MYFKKMFELFSRFPFDWRNPYGYLAAVLIQYVGTFYLFVFATGTLPLAFGGYMLARTVAKDMMMCLNSINDSVHIRANELEINSKFSSFLKMHSDVLELS